MTKKVIKMLKKIDIKIVEGKKLSKIELDLLRALIQSAISDLGGIVDDNNSVGGEKETQ